MAKSAGKTGSVRREARIFDWRTGRRIAAKVVLRMAPDLLFIHETGGARKTLIVDTKWKRLSEEEGGRPSRPDLYQLYAYLHRYDCHRAFLLYPRAAGVLPRDLHALARLAVKFYVLGSHWNLLLEK